MYREDDVENAFEIWLVSGKPYSPNLRDFPFLDRLFDVELRAVEAMIEWHYTCTPTSRRSQTPPPPAIGEDAYSYERQVMQLILERYLEDGCFVRDQMGLVWCGPRAASRVRGDGQERARQNDAESGLPGIQARQGNFQLDELSGAQSSHEHPHLEDRPRHRVTRVSSHVEVGPRGGGQCGARERSTFGSTK